MFIINLKKIFEYYLPIPLQELNLRLTKAPGFNGKKCPHICNLGTFFIIESGELSLCRNPIKVEWV